MADVVIAGYGPAGAAAVIAAHDAGRSVLALELVERGGGDAGYSGGFLFDVPGWTRQWLTWTRCVLGRTGPAGCWRPVVTGAMLRT